MIYGTFQSIYASWTKMLKHLTFEINQRKWERVELLIYEITGSVFGYLVPNKQNI